MTCTVERTAESTEKWQGFGSDQDRLTDQSSKIFEDKCIGFYINHGRSLIVPFHHSLLLIRQFCSMNLLLCRDEESMR